MKYKYMPGCSACGTGRGCEESTRAVFARLGVELEELEDWNCCGATAAAAVNREQSLSLAARNLALADTQQCINLATPCSGCYLALTKAQQYHKLYPELGDCVKSALHEVGLNYTGRVHVRHLLEILVTDVGLEEVKKHVTRPLDEIGVATYYGCQTIRPFSDADDQHNPTNLERLCEVLGAKVVPFPLKTRCCGGSLMGTMPDVAQDLVHALLKEARRNGANTIVTICPLCQFNLDSYQQDIRRRFHEDVSLNVLYYTQLMGLAFGMEPEVLGLPRNISWNEAIMQPEPAVAAGA
jgi:heterodisulfide reductase subunit B